MWDFLGVVRIDINLFLGEKGNFGFLKLRVKVGLVWFVGVQGKQTASSVIVCCC